MYILVYKNGVKMRVVDEAMQKVIQSMYRNGIDYINIIHEDDKKVSVFMISQTKRKKK